ncbi:hypothetical protein K502DRAFT_345200 [Neoconidiobolus thromboides FSU 785]|nr:hypothetical protein K502DRAFT_345200 [Neoconidiobolus thromboides FSU 785]
MQINEYMYENEEYIREKFQHLEHLVLDNSDDLEYYFKAPIIRYLPPTITSLIIQNSPFASFLDLRELVNKFDNLTILELVHIRVDISDFDFLLKKQLPRLNKLHLAFSYGIDIEGICINLDNYPKLEALDIEEDSASGINVISKLKGLTFRGVSNLRKLIMSNVSLVKVIINKETFPKLNQLSLQWCSTLLSKPLYSIFDVSTITFLDISVASYPIFEIFTIIHSNPPEKEYRLFLIKEIYPKHATNLLTLRVQNLVLGYHFFNFLFTLCPNLYNLEIAICSFENDIPFSKHPVVRESTLTNVTFTNIESPNADAFINFILFYFKNISSFKLVNCSDLFPKYKHDPRFCLCKSR